MSVITIMNLVKKPKSLHPDPCLKEREFTFSFRENGFGVEVN